MKKKEHSSGSSDEASDDGEELRMPPPPLDWELNCLLMHLDQEMTKADLDSAKALFHGMDGFGRKLLAEIETPLRLFDSMQKRTFLDRNNILFLQAMLHKIGRMDLFDAAIKYAHSVGDTIHFKKPPSEPANGYQFVKVHIEGTNFKKYKRSNLEALRATAAQLMLVPAQFVTIAGIEPSTSLLVTLMVPSRFIAYLKMALKKTESMETLSNQGVDIVSIDENIYNLRGVEHAELIETEAQIRLKTIYEKYSEAQENLEAREIECIKLKKQVEEHEWTKLGINERMKVVLVQLLHETHVQQIIPKLSRQSALIIYKSCLCQARKLGYNSDVIESLLDAHALVLSARVQEIGDYRFQALTVENNFLKSELNHLSIKNARLLALLNKTDIKEMNRQLANPLKAFIEGGFTVQDPRLLATIGNLDFAKFQTDDKESGPSSQSDDEDSGPTRPISPFFKDILASFQTDDEKSEPALNYVVFIRGARIPSYEAVFTSAKTAQEPVTPMLPPIGLKATVLSANTIVVTWTDNSLGKIQRFTDNRYYTLRYITIPQGRNRYMFIYTTDLVCRIDELKPDTQYEFSVKVTKGKQKSTWSMSVVNTTKEANTYKTEMPMKMSREEESLKILLVEEPGFKNVKNKHLVQPSS